MYIIKLTSFLRYNSTLRNEEVRTGETERLRERHSNGKKLRTILNVLYKLKSGDSPYSFLYTFDVYVIDKITDSVFSFSPTHIPQGKIDRFR